MQGRAQSCSSQQDGYERSLPKCESVWRASPPCWRYGGAEMAWMVKAGMARHRTGARGARGVAHLWQEQTKTESSQTASTPSNDVCRPGEFQVRTNCQRGSHEGDQKPRTRVALRFHQQNGRAPQQYKGILQNCEEGRQPPEFFCRLFKEHRLSRFLFTPSRLARHFLVSPR